MTQPKTDRVQHESENPMDARIEQLKQLFPEAVSEDGINLDTLRNLLGIQFPQKERYSFTWAGKQDAILSLQKRSKATLKPVPEESVNWDSTGHLFIEGDNLEVLKLLYKSYFGRVKMIYIDPPYNTGNDFIYPDDYTEPLENYLRLTGQTDENGTRYSSRMEMNGRKHSAWLSMMYPRLFLARQLLRDDGVIFISIDDNESHHLRMLMDEIFGAENFVAIFPWKKRTAKSDVPFGISQDFEWIICYAKSESFLAGAEHERKYYQTDDYPNDRWRLSDLTKQTSAKERENSAFDLIDPKTGKEYPYNPNRVWVVTRETFPDYYKRGKIVFPDDYPFLNITIPAFRVFESEDRAKSLKKYGSEIAMKALSTQLPPDIGMTESGSKEIADLFGDKVFPFPKPSSLIQYLIATSTNDNDIILDFFAGSCTTAQAVLELNGNRRFIMVQLPEPTDNPAYPTIADIGKERIRRVIQRMTDSEAGKLEGFEQYPNADLGFRVFRLDTSPLRQWEDMPPDTTPDEYIRQMDLFVYEPLLEGWQVADVIAEVALKELGFNLTYRVEHVPSIQELTIYKVTDDEKGQSFYICLDDKITVEAVKPLGLTQDDLFVFRDTAITDTVILNLRLLSRILAI